MQSYLLYWLYHPQLNVDINYYHNYYPTPPAIEGHDGRLDGPCLRGNQCTDAHTFCSKGVCKCTGEHFDKNGVCGELEIMSHL